MSEFLAWSATHAGKSFEIPQADDEYYHKPWPKDLHYEAIETSYFGFNIPEENIVCQIYHWMHPAFGLASGGMFLYQGIHENRLGADYFNWQNYMPMPEDLTDCTYANGVRARCIEPMLKWEHSYSDPDSNTSFMVESTAIMPPAYRPNGGHFTQAVRTQGELILRGKKYVIDGFFTRDRSWSQNRTEKRGHLAPVPWKVPVFNEKLAFHEFSFDSGALNPMIAEEYPQYDSQKNLLFGYVWKDGRLKALKSSQSRSEFGIAGVAPSRVELEMVDEDGEAHRLIGTTRTAITFAYWPNLPSFFCFMEWDYNGLKGYGDVQIPIFEDFARRHFKP